MQQFLINQKNLRKTQEMKPKIHILSNLLFYSVVKAWLLCVTFPAHLQQAVAAPPLPQGFGSGWDHVLLLLSHSKCELAQINT